MLLLEQLHGQVLADRQGLIAAGVRENLPGLADAQRQMDERLNEEPEQMAPVDFERLELLQALGVA